MILQAHIRILRGTFSENWNRYVSVFLSNRCWHVRSDSIFMIKRGANLGSRKAPMEATIWKSKSAITFDHYSQYQSLG